MNDAALCRGCFILHAEQQLQPWSVHSACVHCTKRLVKISEPDVVFFLIFSPFLPMVELNQQNFTVKISSVKTKLRSRYFTKLTRKSSHKVQPPPGRQCERTTIIQTPTDLVHSQCPYARLTSDQWLDVNEWANERTVELSRVASSSAVCNCVLNSQLVHDGFCWEIENWTCWEFI